MQDIWHESLEPHILDPSDHLGRLEVAIGGIPAALARIVHQIWTVSDNFRGLRTLRDFAQRPSLLAEVNDEPHAASLSATYGFLNPIY